MNKNNIKKVVIIGSGPAGLTAGIYTSRANLDPIIIDGANPGGQLMGTSYVENWPGEKSILGATLMQNIRNHAKHFGAQFLSETVIDIDTTKKPFKITTDKNKEIFTHSIIIATGSSAKKLDCPGQNEYWGKGITTCAICDGYFYKDKKVFILGGGDTAMEDASFMQKFTSDITIIHIGEKFSASVPMQQRVLNNKNIKIIYNSTITEFRGNNQQLQEIEIINKKTGEKSSFKADGVFIAIGQNPNTGFVKNKLELSDYGYILTGSNLILNKENNKKMKNGLTTTSVNGIFAAGDVSDPAYKQAIASSGAGCMAALDAERYLAQILE
ncbi:MAG: Thioredoxin reductase [candidate division TM6 bacterium GW2011_GWF2_30_66]|jgi:thioredoxin reductase (NADPH)|nr:MAG: Thioredoxin reductase [candidate division TM6 bacterium GW2011_GWF2_30_66]